MDIREEIHRHFQEWKLIDEDDIYIGYEWSDAYDITRVHFYIHNNKISSCIIESASKDEEIINPYACHECIGEDCKYYDREKDECGITDKNIENEINIWEHTILRRDDITVSRTVLEETCYVNVTHEHIYRGYSIELLNPSIEMILDTIANIDSIIELAEYNKVQID